jgi:2-methylisocitrate lyase-like PEP mutase family enzyme
MSPNSSSQLATVSVFRQLHESGCFLLPNPWDAGSAVALQSLGFKALASTSAGFAFSHALPDSAGAIPLPLLLDHLRDLARATPLPVNADFLAGFGDDPEGVWESVSKCVATGVAGLSIEDTLGPGARRADGPLYDLETALERLRAARKAIDDSGVPVVLTARCEAWLGHPEAERVALERLAAFADAGADCLFAPGVRSPEKIEALVRAVAPKPLNVLMSTPHPELTVARLADLGVRRISIGGSLARIAWGAFLEAARGLATSGTFDSLAGGASYGDLNALFAIRE